MVREFSVHSCIHSCVHSNGSVSRYMPVTRLANSIEIRPPVGALGAGGGPPCREGVLHAIPQRDSQDANFRPRDRCLGGRLASNDQARRYTFRSLEAPAKAGLREAGAWEP